MGVAILISHKIDFKLKSFRRDGEGHFILITGTTVRHQLTPGRTAVTPITDSSAAEDVEKEEH